MLGKLKAPFKESLRSNQLMIGSWLTLAHPGIAEIMAKSGFSWIAVDLEHSVITIREAEELIRVIGLSGAVPLVRLTNNDPNLIKRVMDAGAHGIIVPMVNSEEEARKAVASVYYPPKGRRGVGLARAQGYGSSFGTYKSWLEKEAVIIVQVEHIDAVRNLEKILSSDGVDGFIIGPYDLSASLGYPGQFDHPEVIEALGEIKKISMKLRKPGGFHVVEPDPETFSKYVEDGYTFMAYSLDIRMLDVTCRNFLNKVKL